MEAVLQGGDALWVRQLDIADVKVSSILILSLPHGERMTHRVIRTEPLSGGSYLVATKGDANLFTKEWRISADEAVAIVVARIPLAGHVFAFLAACPAQYWLPAHWLLWLSMDAPTTYSP